MAVPSPTKAEFRAWLRKLRDVYVGSWSLPDRCANAARFAERALPLLAGAKTVAVYLPIGTEVDTLPLIGILDAQGVALALPFYSGLKAPPLFLAWKPGDTLLSGPMGLRQPDPATAAAVDPDAFIVPLLGYTEALDRLGYGAGYYDRAFAAWPDAKRIGIAWDCQKSRWLPIDPWDVRLHAIVTDEGVVS
ncbi:5-formyltetrahydrofolate cyclo-ligase [Sphingomonas antarctica]|uniref:5-formyltetrahydrofolate cyclo-ligase n=1 Tax=Sphingomonas antarctica TaxID=2040274 RepID=UPI0039EC197C